MNAPVNHANMNIAPQIAALESILASAPAMPEESLAEAQALPAAAESMPEHECAPAPAFDGAAPALAPELPDDEPESEPVESKGEWCQVSQEELRAIWSARNADGSTYNGHTDDDLRAKYGADNVRRHEAGFWEVFTPDESEPEAEPEAESAPAPAAPIEPFRVMVAHADLAQAMTRLCAVVERRNTIPILSNVRLLAGHGSAYLTATDLDTELTIGMPAETDRTAGFTVPAHVLKDFARKAAKGCECLFADKSPDGETIAVNFGATRYAMHTLPIDDFPSMEKPGESAAKFELPGHVLREALASVEMAISTEETRYYLNGVYMHVVEPNGVDRYNGSHGQLAFIATDGHRLGRVRVAAPAGVTGMPGVIIRRGAVAVLLKMLSGKNCPESVHLTISYGKARFSWPDHVLTTKLIDGTFPDYNRVIPTGNDKTLSVDSGEFAGAVQAVAAISTERSRAVKLSVESDMLTISVNNPDVGECRRSLPCEFDGPDGFEIGFNSRYLLDLAKTACPKGGTLKFKLADAGSPTLITGERDALYVLMPTRV